MGSNLCTTIIQLVSGKVDMIEKRVSIFESKNALDKLENFSSKFGADFYKLPYNKSKIKLIKKEFQIPDKINIGAEEVIPLFAGEILSWGFSEI